MEGVVVIVIVIVGVVFAARASEKQARATASATAVARLRHLRSGEFPSSCSWCKNTALARKLIVFERTPESWQVTDLMIRLNRCPDDEVSILGMVLQRDQPTWRRICGERCAKEFLEAEHVKAPQPFLTCAYCSTRAPAALVRCPNCGGVRT